MPFTFAHPAAVLPLSYLPKKYISFTALFIGAIMPDMEYFIRFVNISRYSHTWAGLFWFDLPLGILVCFIFHNVVRNPLINHLPQFAYQRTWHCLNVNWNMRFRYKWIIILLCLLAGSTSHIIWDHLTHEVTYDLDQTSFVEDKVIPHKYALVYYSYWGLNSAIGMILLALSFWKMPVRINKIERSYQVSYWPLIFGISLTVLIARYLINHHLGIYNLVDSIISSFLIGLIMAGFINGKYIAKNKKGKQGEFQTR